MLRLRVRIERADGGRAVELVAIANSGFVSPEPEVLLPFSIAERLALGEVAEPEVARKALGDGSEAVLLRYRDTAKVYVVEEDRVEGPVQAHVLASPRALYPLLNDKLLGRMRIVLLDFAEGTWCFRDELGRRERKSW